MLLSVTFGAGRGVDSFEKEPAPPPPALVGENTQSYNFDLPDTTEKTHSETPKETDDTNDADNVSMSETPPNDGRDASHIKSKSSVDAADGVRQRLKFDGEASGMTPDPKRYHSTSGILITFPIAVIVHFLGNCTVITGCFFTKIFPEKGPCEKYTHSICKESECTPSTQRSIDSPPECP